ncbi:hypothetical protein, partial [Cetobacterium sp. ZWU0022]|uniref:hypothetical protein n=1 Tax=Cetobacterium sp. ZWU0022 TaxID=1340502 RepID=UPI001E32CE66
GIPHLGTPFFGGPLLGVANAFPSFCSLWVRIRLFFAELAKLKARFSRAFTGKGQQLRPHFNSPPSLYCYLVGAFPFFCRDERHIIYPNQKNYGGNPQISPLSVISARSSLSELFKNRKASDNLSLTFFKRIKVEIAT